jgi:hypothetical protein
MMQRMFTKHVAIMGTEQIREARFLFHDMCFTFRSRHLFYLLTVGVEVVYFHLITLRHTLQPVGLLWTRDRPDAETSTWQHKHSQETNIHAPRGVLTHDRSKRSAADLRLRPRGHWDRRLTFPVIKNDGCQTCLQEYTNIKTSIVNVCVSREWGKAWWKTRNINA